MSRTVSNKIELEGRVITQPELRITPAGNPLLRFRVDCGERTGELVMPVVMAGGEARMLAEKLKAGSAIHLTGGCDTRVDVRWAVPMPRLRSQRIRLTCCLRFDC
jgi:primosomal replication protein N